MSNRKKAEQLLKYMHEMGYKWMTGHETIDHTWYEYFLENTCYSINKNKTMEYGNFRRLRAEGREITEFTNLVEPELTAEEVLTIYSEINAEHEKKEPEVELVDVIRIVQFVDGLERIVYEETLPEEFDYTEADEVIKGILLKFIKEHEGTYQAYMANIHRVKEEN